MSYFTQNDQPSELRKHAEKLFNAIQNDQHTAEQQDLIRKDLGVYAEDATVEQLEDLIRRSIDGGFYEEQEILGFTNY